MSEIELSITPKLNLKEAEQQLSELINKGNKSFQSINFKFNLGNNKTISDLLSGKQTNINIGIDTKSIQNQFKNTKFLLNFEIDRKNLQDQLDKLRLNINGYSGGTAPSRAIMKNKDLKQAFNSFVEETGIDDEKMMKKLRLYYKSIMTENQTRRADIADYRKEYKNLEDLTNSLSRTTKAFHLGNNNNVMRMFANNRIAYDLANGSQSFFSRRRLDRYLKKSDEYFDAKNINPKLTLKQFKSDPVYTESYTSALAGIAKDPKKLNSINNFGNALGLVAGGAGIAATGVAKFAQILWDTGKDAVKAFEDIQAIKTQLGVVYSSQFQADTAFNQIEKYAKKSPFGVEVMAQQAILLKQSGVMSSELMDVMSRIGDISSGNAEKMKSISDVYARILSSTTMTARDMRQLSNAGVPSYEALSHVRSEKTGEYFRKNEIRSMLQGGKVTARDFENLVKYLTDEGGQFFGAVNIGAKTFKARKQNLSDAKQMAQAYWGEAIATMNLGSVWKIFNSMFTRNENKMYSRNTNKSFYEEAIGILERTFQQLEEWAQHGVMVKEYQKKHEQSEKIFDTFSKDTSGMLDVQKFGMTKLRDGLGVKAFSNAIAEEDAAIAKLAESTRGLREKDINIVGFEEAYKQELRHRDAINMEKYAGYAALAGTTVAGFGGGLLATGIGTLPGSIMIRAGLLTDLIAGYVAAHYAYDAMNGVESLKGFSTDELEVIKNQLSNDINDLPDALKKQLSNSLLDSYAALNDFNKATLKTSESLNKLLEEINSGINILAKEKKLYEQSIIGSFEKKIREYDEHMAKLTEIVNLANKIRAEGTNVSGININGLSSTYEENRQNRIEKLLKENNESSDRLKGLFATRAEIWKEYNPAREELSKVNKRIENLQTSWKQAKNAGFMTPAKFEGKDIKFGYEYKEEMDKLLAIKNPLQEKVDKNVDSLKSNEKQINDETTVKKSLLTELKTTNLELINFTKSVSDLYNVNSVHDGIDWKKVTINDYENVVKLLSTSHNPLSHLKDYRNPEEGQSKTDIRLTEAGIEDAKIYKKNLERVYTILDANGIEEKYLLELTQILRRLEGIANGTIISSGTAMRGVQNDVAILNKNLVDNKLNGAAFILQDARTERTFDVNPQIKQKTPYKWQYAQANLTGLNPALVALSGTSNVMSYYKNNTLPRQTMANLSKAMLSNNKIDYLTIGKIISENAGKYNGRQMYETNFKEIAKQLEEIAKNGDKNARDAYVNSKQEQINKLDEMFVNGMTSIDEAEEIRKLADANGMAFSYRVTKDELGRSMATFSELTIETARNLRDQLTNEKIQQSIINSFKDVADTIKENFNNLSTQSAVALDNIIVTSDAKEREQILKYMSDAVINANKAFANAPNQLALLTGVQTEMYKKNKWANRAEVEEEFINNHEENSDSNIFKGTSFENYPLLRKRFFVRLEEEAEKRFNTPWMNLKDEQFKEIFPKNSESQNIAKKAREAYKTKTVQEPVTNFKIGDKAADFNEGGMYRKDLELLGVEGIYDKYIQGVKNNSSKEMNQAQEKFQKAMIDFYNNLSSKTADERKSFDLLVKYTFGSAEAMLEVKKEGEKSVKAAKALQEELEIAALRDRNISLAFKDKEESEKKNDRTSGWHLSFQGDIMKDLGVDEDTTWEAYYDMFGKSLPKAYTDFLKFDKTDIRAAQNMSLFDYIDKDEADRLQNILSESKEIFTSELSDIVKGQGQEKFGELIQYQLANSNISFDNEKLQGKVDNITKNGLQGKESLEDLYDILTALDDKKLELFSPEQLAAFGIMSAKAETLEEDMKKFGKGMSQAFESGALDIANKSFEAIGQHIGDIIHDQNKNISLSERWAKTMKASVGAIMSQIGPMMTLAGLNMIAQGTEKKDFMMGLALAAAGGVASIFSGILGVDKNEKDTDDEYERLEKLRDNLKELLEQARDDASYYEAEMMNKRAIATNNDISSHKVNDMILTPQGNFSTHPDDYIIATKTPQLLNGGGARGGATINSYVYNSASDRVSATTEARQNDDGSFDLVTTINAVVSKAMADGEYNDAMAIAQQNQNGRQVYA